jgi:hypothetical protein
MLGLIKKVGFPFYAVARTAWAFNVRYGYLKTTLTRQCQDAVGNWLPWYTYPAIEYLKQLDFSEKNVFEYGAGSSTLFWAAHAKAVYSVENDWQWVRWLRQRLPKNCTLDSPSWCAYAGSIYHDDAPHWDVVVVDGEQREACAAEARVSVKPDGLIVLDNSDWFPNAARMLRDSGFTEIDFTGFGPINFYPWTTSIFFRREFNPMPLGRQPKPGPAAIIQKPVCQ